MKITKARKNFPIVERCVYLDSASHSPCSIPVLEAMTDYLNFWMQTGGDLISKMRHGLLRESKRLFADLINAQEKEISMVPNTSAGINMVVDMLQCERGQNIVTNDLEHPSVVYPFLKLRKRGVKVRYVKSAGGRISFDDYESAIDDKTAAVAVSAVEFSNGFRNDLGGLADVAHSHGAYLVVDGCQALGALRCNVKRNGVDFLASSCFKWQLGPYGTGYLYVKKGLFDRFEPPAIGWMSVQSPGQDRYDLRRWRFWNSAAKYEFGTPSAVGYAGVRAALEMIKDIGIDQIERRVLSLTDYLISGLQSLGLELQTPAEKEYRSGIVNFRLKDPIAVVDNLRKHAIIVAPRANGIRVSPHFFNTFEELNTLLERLTRIMRS